jgi:hypothetical protein
MRVLVACEFSGVVRDAFIARGHDAMSVDLLPSERPGPHYRGNILDFLETGADGWGWGSWDLMIAHPPCTYLANSGVRWLYGGKGTTRDPRRWNEMLTAAEFFASLLTADIPRIAVENPIMHKWARAIIEEDAKHLTYERQTIQPWQYGHGEVKATQLWLKGLPPLTPTNIVDGREARVHRMAPSPSRGLERSRTLQGIADAMAEQWGGLPSD